MKPAGIICIVFLLMAAISAQSQSLGELGKKEKERRAKVKQDVKVLTNQDADKFKNAPITTGTPATPSDSSAATEDNAATPPNTEAKPAKPADDEPHDLKGRTEGYWRQTLADARQKVKDLENQGNVLTLRLSDLQNQFYRESDGFKQQDIQREIQKTFYEQDLNKQNQEAAKAQLSDLENEARKSGALPGWLQPKP